MIAWIVGAAVLLLFSSSLAAYMLHFRRRIDGDTKLYDGGFALSGVCLCLVCLGLGAWQLSKGKSSNNNLGGLGV